MKWGLFMCLLTISVIYSCKQPANSSRTASRECLYHIKFYNWQWDYIKAIGYDTIPKYSKQTGKYVDSIVWDTSFHAFNRVDSELPVPLPDSFINSPRQLFVISCDSAKKYEVTSFDIVYRQGSSQSSMTISSSTIPIERLKQFEEFIERDSSSFRVIIEAHLKGIKDAVETSYGEIKRPRK